MIDLPPAGGGIRTRDLVVESRRVQDHWAIPVTPSKWYPKYPLVPKKKNQPNTFRIHPTPSEFTQHLQNLPTTFRIHPPPSEFTHHLQHLPTPSLFLCPFSVFTTRVHITDENLLTPAFFKSARPLLFCLTQHIGVGAVGSFFTFWTFCLTSKTSVFTKMGLW